MSIKVLVEMETQSQNVTHTLQLQFLHLQDQQGSAKKEPQLISFQHFQFHLYFLNPLVRFSGPLLSKLLTC